MAKTLNDGRHRLVLIDEPGPARDATVQLLEALLPVRVDARPVEPDAPPSKLISHLESNRAAIRVVLLCGDAVVSSANAASPCQGFRLLRDILRNDKLKVFPIILVPRSSRTTEVNHPWKPSRNLLERAGYTEMPSRVDILPLIDAVAKTINGNDDRLWPERASVSLEVEAELLGVAKQELDKQAEVLRHTFDNCKAAVRLFIGAYALGEIGKEVFDAGIEEMKKREKTEIVVRSEDLRPLEELRRQTASSAFTALATHKKLRGGAKVLLVDDQCHHAGWDIFFDAILRARMCYAETREQAMEMIAKEGESIDLVLLDLRLSSDPLQADPKLSLKFLQSIKELHLDLPVLVFSAMDQVQYSRNTLRFGAANYFVKELTEGNRASIDYYRKFREMFEQSLADPEWRTIWKESKAYCARFAANPQNATFMAIRTCLRRAYYALTADENDPRVQLLFADEESVSSIDDYCHLECGKAIELAVYTRYWRLPNRSQKLDFRPTCNALKEAGLINESDVQSAFVVWGRRNATVHLKFADEAPKPLPVRQAPAPISAIEVMKRTLALLQLLA